MCAIVMIGFLMCSMIVLDTAQADTSKSSHGVRGSINRPMEFNYLDNQYCTEFETVFDLDMDSQGSGWYQIVNNKLWLISLDSGGKMTADTRMLGMDGSAFFNLPCYAVEVVFIPTSNWYGDHWWIYKGPQFGLYVSDEIELHAFHYTVSGSQRTEEWNEMDTIYLLDYNQEYSILVWYYRDGTNTKFDIYLNGVLEDTYTSNYIIDDLQSCYFRFGDDDASSGVFEGKGSMKYDAFSVCGHTTIPFFDGFDDGNPYNWHFTQEWADWWAQTISRQSPTLADTGCSTTVRYCWSTMTKT